MDNEIIIEPKESKDSNGCKVVSLRVKSNNLRKIDLIVKETNHSRNAVINMFLEYGLSHYKIIKKNEQ